MRVIAGEFRSRRLKSLPGLDTRPTPDQLREALFNVLAPRIENTVFLDAYAGTGAVGIEALSRGARQAIFLEKSPAAIKVIEENLESLQLSSRAVVVRGSVASTLARQNADIVFIDPPYDSYRDYESAMRVAGEKAPPLVLVQHHKKHRLAERYGSLVRGRVLMHSENAISFYSPVKVPAGQEMAGPIEDKSTEPASSD